ncbi:hypothetical protein LOTGIDRAFT_170704 [Lottia gigantea]|uniref:Uncharacterized protein n=1 Tax=Lottia gigantea TaxID=225164 RepID=V4AJU6_LOTGI|nr:hypothetical protein LOTGIDRAFT_170704 [Lottia gigantea]ESP04459.1 hypothetical protein LOTGIDRAFT_170704 [Lottia gigantea]
MANKFGLGSLPLESKYLVSSTAFINKAKPFFVDQIGDTLQGDIVMINFKITNLKFPGNDNDALNKKYLLDQINAIQIDKDHVENRINDVKKYFRRNIKNLVDEPKLQQELTSLKRLIQVDKTSQLQNLISKLDDKITKVKIDVQRLIDNPNVNEDRLKRKLTALERKLGELLAELDKTADKTELQNSISNLNEKIAKQKSDVQDIINTLPIDKDTLKRQLTALDTKITDELEKEVASTVLTVGVTVATAVTGGLMLPVIVPTVLAALTAVQTTSCGLITLGFTSKKKAHYKKKTDILNMYLNQLYIFFERSREDKNITVEELKEFNEILDKFHTEISAVKIKK